MNMQETKFEEMSRMRDEDDEAIRFWKAQMSHVQRIVDHVLVEHDETAIDLVSLSAASTVEYHSFQGAWFAVTRWSVRLDWDRVHVAGQNEIEATN